MNITIPLRELLNVLLLDGLMSDLSLIRYKNINESLCYFPNDVLLREVGILHFLDEYGHGTIYNIHAARMKIEQILGYSAEDILKWSDEELIRNCQEHFIYTRPVTPPPKEKKKVKVTDDVIEVGADGVINVVKSKPKKLTAQQEAANALQRLLSPENLAKLQQIGNS
jgi:hypothetical protein